MAARRERIKDELDASRSLSAEAYLKIKSSYMFLAIMEASVSA